MKQLVTFFGLSYFISWAIWFPLYGHIFGVYDLPVLPYHHALGGFGPFLSSFITTRIYSGRAGVKKLIRQCFRISSWFYLLVALFSPFVLAFIATGISSAGGQAIELSGLLQSKEFPEFSFFGFFIYNLIFFGFGEETGWRGFALPALQSEYNALAASIILTFFWALWHWPLFFYRPGYVGMGLSGTAGWVFSLLTGSILLTWMYNSSKAGILVCAVFHATIDIAFTADFPDKNMMSYMGMLITIWGIVTIAVFKPSNLSRHKRETIKRD